MEKLSNGSSQYGSSMGRRNNVVDAAYPVVFEIERIKSATEAYDVAGAYWGIGEPIYRAQGDSAEAVEQLFVRAKDIVAAKAAITETYPNATFAVSADLDAFVSGYKDAALFSSTNPLHDEDPENEKEMLDDTEYEISEETISFFQEQCAEFMKKNAAVLQEVVSEKYSLEKAGGDFWLTRNHHGAGFWDRDLGEAGKKLTEAAHRFSEDNLWVDDEKLIRSEHEPARAATPTI